MNDDELFDWMESQMGLHRTIELLYVVDGYCVSLVSNDGATVEAEAGGPTLKDAVKALQRCVQVGGTPPT